VRDAGWREKLASDRLDRVVTTSQDKPHRRSSSGKVKKVRERIPDRALKQTLDPINEYNDTIVRREKRDERIRVDRRLCSAECVVDVRCSELDGLESEDRAFAFYGFEECPCQRGLACSCSARHNYSRMNLKLLPECVRVFGSIDNMTFGDGRAYAVANCPTVADEVTNSSIIPAWNRGVPLA
jgi:hypothetical protein